MKLNELNVQQQNYNVVIVEGQQTEVVYTGPLTSALDKAQEVFNQVNTDFYQGTDFVSEFIKHKMKWITYTRSDPADVKFFVQVVPSNEGDAQL